MRSLLILLTIACRSAPETAISPAPPSSDSGGGGVPELCNDQEDDDDPSTTEQGRASFVDANGDWSDLSAAFGDTHRPGSLRLDQPGTLRLCEGEFVGRIELAADVRIEGAGAEATRLDAALHGSAVSIQGEHQVEIEGLEIWRGSGDQGGGISCSGGGHLQLAHSTIHDSGARWGGAIGLDGCSAQLQHVEIHSSWASDAGGGIALRGGDLSIEASQLARNGSDVEGGNLFAEAALVQMESSQLSGGEAPQGGNLALGPDAHFDCTGSGGLSLGLAERGGAVWMEPGSTLESAGCDWGDEADPIDDNAPNDLQSPAWIASDYGAAADFRCEDAGCSPVPISSILIAPISHVDPIAADAEAGPLTYGAHREALLWNADLLAAHGAGLSAMMTGLYAEAVIHSGDAEDFRDFMPGGRHLLGSHFHSHWKDEGDGDWEWTAEGDQDKLSEGEQLAIFTDQVYWVNEIFRELGHEVADNRWLHGVTLDLGEEMIPLYNIYPPSTVPYDNAFTRQIGAARGAFHPYRGDWGLRDDDIDVRSFEDPDDVVIRVPVQSGLFGYDEVHGNEGFVYGTRSHIQRQFLIVYLEWRERERGAVPSQDRVWLFSWSIHPIQSVYRSTTTDGQDLREEYEELLFWLEDHFVARSTPRGQAIARYGHLDDVADAFDVWDDSHGAISQMNVDEDGVPLYALGPVVDTLVDYSYVRHIPGLPEGVYAVELEHPRADPMRLAWSDVGEVELDISGATAVYHADGTVKRPPDNQLQLGASPVRIQYPRPTLP